MAVMLPLYRFSRTILLPRPAWSRSKILSRIPWQQAMAQTTPVRSWVLQNVTSLLGCGYLSCAEDDVCNTEELILHLRTLRPTRKQENSTARCQYAKI
jgi:hypothetical protein